MLRGLRETKKVDNHSFVTTLKTARSEISFSQLLFAKEKVLLLYTRQLPKIFSYSWRTALKRENSVELSARINAPKNAKEVQEKSE